MKYENYAKVKALVSKIDNLRNTLSDIGNGDPIVTIKSRSGLYITEIYTYTDSTDYLVGPARDFIEIVKGTIQKDIDEATKELELL
jgi:hypothetical protein